MRVRFCYQTVTPESAEHGDPARPQDSDLNDVAQFADMPDIAELFRYQSVKGE